MDVLANGMLQSPFLLNLLALNTNNTMHASDYMGPSTIY